MKLVILHFRQKELYPPLLNMLAFLDQEGIAYKFIGGYKSTASKNKGINQIKLYVKYLKFVLSGFFAIMSTRRNVLYYESISALPVELYNRLLPTNRLRIFIHFHEYFSKNEYKNQSFLEKTGRAQELDLFKKAVWISHTNKDRLELFKRDIGFEIKTSVLRTMPNYPPKSWSALNKSNIGNSNSKIKLLHIGSLSFAGLYLKELLDHFGNDERFEMHFYSHIKNAEVIESLKKYSNVLFHGSIAYNDIPTLRGSYDIGLVLYKGESLNFTYNAPNKIFEYLALDLDVWCSDKLLTAAKYQNQLSYPKVIMVDFENLDSFDDLVAIDRKNLNYQRMDYFCENVYADFVAELKKSK